MTSAQDRAATGPCTPKDRKSAEVSAEAKLEMLRNRLRGVGSAVVAFSSGVDSTFLLRVAHDDVENVCEALREMRKVTDIGLCASLGLLSEDDLKKLKEAGLQRVHCNLETAPSLFPSLCTTHTTADKLATLRAAKRLVFQICCGGII